jgi:hypothetical protein
VLPKLEVFVGKSAEDAARQYNAWAATMPPETIHESHDFLVKERTTKNGQADDRYILSIYYRPAEQTATSIVPLRSDIDVKQLTFLAAD